MLVATTCHRLKSKGSTMNAIKTTSRAAKSLRFGLAAAAVLFFSLIGEEIIGGAVAGVLLTWRANRTLEEASARPANEAASRTQACKG
jgi:hypothetical protein